MTEINNNGTSLGINNNIEYINKKPQNKTKPQEEQADVRNYDEITDTGLGRDLIVVNKCKNGGDIEKSVAEAVELAKNPAKLYAYDTILRAMEGYYRDTLDEEPTDALMDAMRYLAMEEIDPLILNKG